MKTCAYCGRETVDDAAHCDECGSEFVEPQPVVVRDREWTKWLGLALRYVLFILFFGLLYFLSFGPVWRYCRSAAPATTAAIANRLGSGFTVVRTVRYPTWVGIVYYPAFKLRSSAGPGSLYASYLDWWDRLGEPD